MTPLIMLLMAPVFSLFVCANAATFSQKQFKVMVIKESELGVYDTTYEKTNMLILTDGYYRTSKNVYTANKFQVKEVKE
jgi:hypothetical protein